MADNRFQPRMENAPSESFSTYAKIYSTSDPRKRNYITFSTAMGHGKIHFQNQI